MSNGYRTLVASLAASATLVLFVSSALGQEIRTYGDQGSDSGGGGQQSQTVYPGQPAPQSQQSADRQTTRQQQNRQQSEEEGGDQRMESYEIRIHEDSKKPSDRREGRKAANLNRPDNQMYKGIIPGDRDEVDHLRGERESGRSRSGPNRLTWIGFQPKEDKSRIFIQMASSPNYSVSRRDDGERVVITLENAEVAAGNFRRRIDTSYFDRAITRIDTKVVDRRTLELHISLRERKNPTVEAKEDYLYVDFDYDNPRDDESDQSGE